MEPRKGKQAPPIYTYLDTIFWTFHFDIEKPGFIQSEFFELFNFDDVRFCFQAVTSSDTTIAIELLRVMVNPDTPRDDGHILEIYMALLGSRVAAECRIIESNDYVSVDYEIVDLKKSYIEDILAVKCVIKLKEPTFLDNNFRNQQENLLRVMETYPRGGKVSKDKICAMAGLLKRKSINKIFTGRQGHYFAINKCIFIERTLRYAEEIYKKIEAKKGKASYAQKHQPLIYLFYIYCGGDGKISKREAAELYVAAHYYGLEYLQVECEEFLLKDLEHEFLTEALLVADFVNDQNLLHKLLEISVNRINEMIETTSFSNMVDRENLYSFSLKHVLNIKWQTELLDESSDSFSTEKSFVRKFGRKRHGKGRKS